MLHWCSPANHVGLSSRRQGFEFPMEHLRAVTDGTDEPSGLEAHFPRGIPSLNLGRGVEVAVRTRSLVWLKRFAHNELILGSNPSGSIGKLAYSLLCGFGRPERHTTGERNEDSPNFPHDSECSTEAVAPGCRPDTRRFDSCRSDLGAGVQVALWCWKHTSMHNNRAKRFWFQSPSHSLC